MTYKGHVEHNNVILDEQAELRDGQEVTVVTQDTAERKKKAFINFLSAHPIVIPDDFKFNRDEIHER